MEMITSLEGLAGKVVKKAACIGYGDGVALIFEDGAVARFTVERGHDNDASVRLSGDGLEPQDLFGLGFITEEEMRTRFQEQQRERDEVARHRREEMYRELKAEFEPSAR